MSVEVRLRHVDSTKAVRLGDVPFDRLDTVLPTLTGWGVTVDGDDYPTMLAQFVVTDTAAYFEVVVEP